MDFSKVTRVVSIGCKIVPSVNHFSTSSHLFSHKEKPSEPDDSDFFKHMARYLRNPEAQKKRYKSLLNQCKMFYEEQIQSTMFYNKEYQFEEPGTIDMLFTFEKEEDLNRFVVTTDSSKTGGYSSASLKLTDEKTALFSGNICTTVPKGSDIVRAGYANISTKRNIKSFYRRACFDWTYYTHLVLKVRGDGRKYRIVLPTPLEFDDTFNYNFNYPLHTRGGPYWQITKIPFSHFVLLIGGRYPQKQDMLIPLNKITNFGITISDSIDGPFKLEIDYVGLENIKHHKDVMRYESYTH